MPQYYKKLSWFEGLTIEEMRFELGLTWKEISAVSGRSIKTLQRKKSELCPEWLRLYLLFRAGYMEVLGPGFEGFKAFGDGAIHPPWKVATPINVNQLYLWVNMCRLMQAYERNKAREKKEKENHWQKQLRQPTKVEAVENVIRYEFRKEQEQQVA